MQVAFGTTAISFTLNEFHCFIRMLLHSSCQEFDPEEVHEKVMSLPLPDENVMLVLTAAEVNHLTRMLLESSVLLEAYHILEATVPPVSGDKS